MKLFYEIVNSLLCAYHESQAKDIDGLVNIITQKYDVSKETETAIRTIFDNISSFDKKAEERKKCRTKSEWVQKELLHLKDKVLEKGIVNPEQFINQVSDTIAQSFKYT